MNELTARIITLWVRCRSQVLTQSMTTNINNFQISKATQRNNKQKELTKYWQGQWVQLISIITGKCKSFANLKDVSWEFSAFLSSCQRLVHVADCLFRISLHDVIAFRFRIAPLNNVWYIFYSTIITKSIYRGMPAFDLDQSWLKIYN